ncbi:MAG: hypothetical protein COV72_07420 [Candidatus Omnitrophica bacterium CG11_big_fil_rev_8_21_14_0_20_42_13]|uniref:Uncharacterized protein n=1 Tax=Candidatus Ghiorseimicrobium undicola TaxID=1974746 RepID=A0A2H0LVY3_9BACT|nr:MAG: hypothetical protein COV72_07420 [Candidatus Omnitrophica bacterium CG11_big_fil_rev_8_21_14_0_20_42_13]
MDKFLYTQKQEEDFKRHEDQCLRCGSCCGAYDGDPCRNLVKISAAQYQCKDYEHRIGQQMTVSGKHFACIPIRVFLTFNSGYPNCAYSKKI